jgi:creatinine amidohydrolase
MDQDDDTAQCLDRIPWPEVARTLAREPRLLLPVGALEQHGPHLPVGANTRIAEGVAHELSRRLGILVAPAFPYGVNLPGSRRFAGTAGLRRKTLHRALNELLAAWEDHGVSEFVLIAAHRSEAHLDALLLALTSESRTTVFDLYGIRVDDLLGGEAGPEHAGELETSLLLHLAPELVVGTALEDAPPGRAALRKYTRGRTPTPPVESRGVLGSPTRATAATGEAIFRRWTETLEAALRR